MKVGSLVECINDVFLHPRAKTIIPNRPIKGRNYFIREIVDARNGEVGIYLEEIENPKPLNGLEPTFKITRFKEIEGLDMAVEELLEESLLADI
jgi:hypothetical protein